MKKIAHAAIAASFILSVFLVPAAYIFVPRGDVSYSERRRLSPLPDITKDGLIFGSYFNELDDYLTDNVPARDALRMAKALFQTRVLKIKENNSIAVLDGCAAKIIKKISAASLANALSKWRAVIDEHISGRNTNNYFAVIPDKSYFFSRDYGYPSSKCEDAAENIAYNLPGFEYIDLFSVASLSDYYKTDTHIAQERAGKIVDAIFSSMKTKKAASRHAVREAGKFYGVYRGQSALPLAEDELNYVTSDVLEKCTVSDCVRGRYIPMYDFNAANGRDGYEMFLGGAVGILRIDNPSSKTDRRLLVFRDSFGSALCPLLAENYKSTTVVDLRYASSDMIARHVDADGCDVLFLYSVHTLENSFEMK